MLLVYNIDALESEAGTALITFLNSVNEPWRQLGYGDLELTVEYLLADGQGQMNKGPKNPPDITFLLIDGDIALRNRILDGLREYQIDLPYKAVTTENNRKWLLGDLVTHIIEEDKEIKTLMKIQKLLAASTAFQEGDYEAADWKNFIDAQEQVKKVLECAQNHDLEKDEADNCLKQFNNAVLTMLGQMN